MSDLPVPSMTATIGGVVTNRVKARTVRQPKQLKQARRPPLEPNVGTSQVCISVPPATLAMIDNWAAACQMNRSRFMVAAAFHFAAKVIR